MILFVYLIFITATTMPLNLKYLYLPYCFKVKVNEVKVNEIVIFLVVIWTYCQYLLTNFFISVLFRLEI